MSPPESLPPRPSLEHLKAQAADLRRGQPDVSVAQSLYMVARNYGFESWPALKHHVASHPPATTTPQETPMATSSAPDRKELYTFTQQLATLMMSGVGILEAFEVCAETATSPAFKGAIMDIRSKLREGEGISSRLKLYPHYFDGMYVQMVSAGEETGTLDRMLDRIAAYIEKIERDGPLNPMVLVTRQLATMAEAGLPFANSLAIIGENADEPALRRALLAASADVGRGVRPDEALAKHRGVFDGYLINMVRAGLTGGNLAQILDRTATHLERREAFGKR